MIIGGAAIAGAAIWYLAPLSVPTPYYSAKYKFSADLPHGYHDRFMHDYAYGSDYLFFETGKGDTIQIAVRPWDEAPTKAVTEEAVRSGNPGIEMANVHPVQGGIVFDSEDEAWEGPTREIWFIHEGSLYQITTYARDIGALQAIWRSWKWEQDARPALDSASA